MSASNMMISLDEVFLRQTTRKKVLDVDDDWNGRHTGEFEERST